MKITGLSGHEIYCINKLGYQAGDVLVGNSVYSLGFIGGITSGVRGVLGGEITQFTSLIQEGRETAYDRMEKEALDGGAAGITGVTSELIFHDGNVEFLSIGSSVHKESDMQAGVPKETLEFSTSADGQELYTQIDAGYTPHKFVFGNVAYSIGLTGGIIGGLKTLVKGEIKEFSDIFNQTRNLALTRIVDDAKKKGANAVLGIETTILPFAGSGYQEMLMIGTASQSDLISGGVITSDLTCQEMWNLNELGYMPMRLLLGTSVYSLGLAGGVTSFFKSFVRGEISELSELIYSAREESLGIIKREAEAIGADEVVGVKTYVYQLGSGLIEFLAIGTAVKKIPGAKNKTATLIPQAIIKDQDTFFNAADYSFGVDLNKGGR